MASSFPKEKSVFRELRGLKGSQFKADQPPGPLQHSIYPVVSRKPEKGARAFWALPPTVSLTGTPLSSLWTLSSKGTGGGTEQCLRGEAALTPPVLPRLLPPAQGSSRCGPTLHCRGLRACSPLIHRAVPQRLHKPQHRQHLLCGAAMEQPLTLLLPTCEARPTAGPGTQVPRGKSTSGEESSVGK